MSTKVYHPKLPHITRDVPDDQVNAWKAQGWVTKSPPRAPRRKKASQTKKEND